MQCSMKEHRHPRDMIFIVCAGGRDWGGEGAEVRGGDGETERAIYQQ